MLTPEEQLVMDLARNFPSKGSPLLKRREQELRDAMRDATTLQIQTLTHSDLNDFRQKVEKAREEAKEAEAEAEADAEVRMQQLEHKFKQLREELRGWMNRNERLDNLIHPRAVPPNEQIKNLKGA